MQFDEMKSVRFACVVTMAHVLVVAAAAQAVLAAPKVGDQYEIRRTYETSTEGSDGSSSSSSGRNSLSERVVAIRANGVELEYDLPSDASADARLREWKFPARVLRAPDGRMQLLNADELEGRLATWLKAAKWDRSVCGRWIFTWNAFHIDCDPQSVIPVLQEYDLRSVDPKSDGTVTTVDSRAIQRARAESDVIIGEISGKSVLLEVALKERAKETISGKISVSIGTDSAGAVRSRTKVTITETKFPDGRSETEKATVIVERQPVG